MSLRLKTIQGVLWNAFEIFGGKIVQILITIILARILAPEDFGIIGLLVIFTELSKVILDSGFSQALIRKQDANQKDFTSVFYFNIIVGVVLYIFLYYSAPFISDFYNFPELKNISRVVFFTIIINSFGIVQNAKIVQAVNFKILASRTIIANIFSGVIAIYLAYIGFGVWALVWQMVIASFLRVALLWAFSKWLPSFHFDFEPVKGLFPFSRNLLLSGLFDVIASNIQTLLIGKFYSKTDLGYYSQAKLIAGIPSQTLTQVIRNVTYPTLSVLQDKQAQLKEAYRKVIKIAVFAVFPVMLGLMVIGDNMIPIVLGEKWIPAIPYFMILCTVGAFFPLYSINQNIFLVRGQSKLYLRVSIAKRLITLTAIFITVQISVLAIVLGHLIATIINTLLTMYFSGKIISYTFKEQINDVLGVILISTVMAGVMFYLDFVCSSCSNLVTLIIQTLSGIIIFFVMAFLFRISVLNDIKDIMKNLFKNV